MPAEDDDRTIILERLKRAVEGRPEAGFDNNTPRLYAEPDVPLVDYFRQMAEKVDAHVICVDKPGETARTIAELIRKEGWQEIACPEREISELIISENLPVKWIKELSEETEIAITGCEYLVASLGSVIVSSAQAGSRKIFIYPPVHIVVAKKSQIVETLEEGYYETLLKYGEQLPSMISIITGPSRTADIEKTLVLGAHGPKKLYIFILNDTFSLK